MLDYELIRRRRQQQLISKRELAAAIGGTGPMIDRLEDGENHDTIPLGRLAALVENARR